MPRYTDERKAAVLGKLLPPHNKAIPDIAAAEGISEATLYHWLKRNRSRNSPAPIKYRVMRQPAPVAAEWANAPL